MTGELRPLEIQSKLGKSLRLSVDTLRDGNEENNSN